MFLEIALEFKTALFFILLSMGLGLFSLYFKSKGPAFFLNLWANISLVLVYSFIIFSIKEVSKNFFLIEEDLRWPFLFYLALCGFHLFEIFHLNFHSEKHPQNDIKCSPETLTTTAKAIHPLEDDIASCEAGFELTPQRILRASKKEDKETYPGQIFNIKG
jgi:hypothetical protein